VRSSARAIHWFDSVGDDLPSDASLGPGFFITQRYPHLPKRRYPILYGNFPSGSKRPLLEPIMRTGGDPPACHSLLLDRRDRRAYVSERGQSMILSAILAPEEGDAHNVFVNGTVMSPGSEDYNLSPA
jgi:hypothetical protein